MVSESRRPIESEILLLKNYLKTVEHLLEVAEQENRAKQREELEAERQEYYEEIAKRNVQLSELTSEEEEKVFYEALEKWENSWMLDGIQVDHSYDEESYYDAPEYEIEIINLYLESLESIELLFDFKYVLRSSFFVHLYSFIEVRLNQECDWLREKQGLSRSVRDLREGQGIHRVKLYLREQVGIELSRIPNWSTITTYNKLRNCIAHAHGILPLCKDGRYLKE